MADDYGGINNQHRIMKIIYQKSLLIELNNNEFVWAFRGQYGSTLKGYGTGAGTVNRPVSLDVDYQGNLYYTQTGDYFPLHMLIPNLSGDFATYPSGFQPNADDIMNVQSYNYLSDVYLDKNKNIYAVGKEDNEVFVFNSQGEYFKSAGNIGDTLSILKTPVAVAVDERGVLYVCNSGDSTVHRFKLSNSLDEDLTSED